MCALISFLTPASPHRTAHCQPNTLTGTLPYPPLPIWPSFRHRFRGSQDSVFLTLCNFDYLFEAAAGHRNLSVIQLQGQFSSNISFQCFPCFSHAVPMLTHASYNQGINYQMQLAAAGGGMMNTETLGKTHVLF